MAEDPGRPGRRFTYGSTRATPPRICERLNNLRLLLDENRYRQN